MMKRIILIFGILSCLAVTTASARETIDLNRNWQFAYGALNPRTVVDLPHTWNHDAIGVALRPTRGPGNYIRDVEMPLDWQGKRVYIRFHGVSSATHLFVNGRFAGEHLGGYTAFTFEITPLLRFGETNNLWVRVSNASGLDYMPVSGDLNVYGGIHRDVELIVVEPAHFALDEHGSDGVYLSQTAVEPQQARIDAKIRVNAATAGNYEIAVEVYDPQRDSTVLSASERVRVQGGVGWVDIPLSIKNPHLWQGRQDPFRYEFRMTLTGSGRTLDSLTVPMGLRSLVVDPTRGLLLNGAPYPLRGVTRVEDRMSTGSALSMRQQQQDMDLLLEMGANAVRMKGAPQSPDFYDLCDRAGIIVWSEIPFTGLSFSPEPGYIHKPGFRENGKQQLAEMILQRYNNCSVLCWGLFSNLSTRGTDSPVEYLRELNALAGTLDPTRPTVASSDQDGEINFITGLIGWSQYLGWSGGKPADVDLWLNQLEGGWSNLRSGIGEYGAGGALSRQGGETLQRPDPFGVDHPERWQTLYHEQVYAIFKHHPSLWGTFAHSLFDYGTTHSSFPGSDLPGVSDFGLVSYDRQEKKDAFYFYKANWNTDDPFVHIAEKRWNRRTQPLQSIRVYSNQSEVELWLNGASQGTQTGENGIFRWDNIPLHEGANTVEARTPTATDRTVIEWSLKN
jgi:beta-galactosidase